MPRKSLLQRFMENVNVNGPQPEYGIGRCWVWTGTKKKGYGRIRVNGRPHPAHHVALALTGIVRPDWAECVRHLCGRKDCVNPAHLAWSTVANNNLDLLRHGRASRAFRDGRCKRGHELAKTGIYVDPSGGRKCVACERMRQASPDYREKNRANARRYDAVRRASQKLTQQEAA